MDGIVCRLCARRAERALMTVPRVECVSVDSTTSVVDIRHVGVLTPKDVSDLEQALDKAVIARSGRKLLNKLAVWLRQVRL